MKKITFFTLSILMIGGAVSLYSNPYQPFNPRGNIAEKYYRGEVSLDTYLDSLGAPPKREPETTIYHGNGRKTIISPGPYGQGTIYHSDGSKSVYKTQ